MVADRANQMEIQIPLGVEVGQDQGTHALHQTTQTCLIESHHHHHQAVETGIQQFYYYFMKFLCLRGSMVL